MNPRRLITLLLLAGLPLVSLQPSEAACTYNNATTSFGANYWNHQQSSATSVACVAPTTPARLLNTSLARTTITATMTGDLKFLVKNTSGNNTPPAFAMIASMSPESKQFPDSGIVAPVGGGCNDAGVTTGIDAIERHLHRTWPLFGKTYYYGDYNANPPNDPATVTLPTSPYTKWTPFNSAANTPLAGGDEYIYMDPSNESQGGSQAYGWGPQKTGVSADNVHPLMKPGHADGCVDAGLTGTQASDCRACLTAKGYYLADGTTPGDLKKSVFKGYILNDYPPAWAHFAWAFGFVVNFQLRDTSNKPLFPIVRDLSQSNPSAACPATVKVDHVGGTFEPVGSGNCSLAYPTWNWSAVQALGMSPVRNDQQNIEGGNNGWGSGARFSWPNGQGASTPAGDLLSISNSLQTFTQSTCKYCQLKATLYIGFGIPCAEKQPTGLPAQTMAPCTDECNYTNPAAECHCGGTTTTNWLPATAHYLYNSLGTRTYFIGMGSHTASMRRAAAEGHGKYFDATDTASFHDGLLNVLVDLINAATATTTSTVNAVQVNVAGQEELVPRFVAKSGVGNYEGHLLKYYLFNEFAANCTAAGATAQVPNSLQPVCTATCVCPGGTCSATWLVDSQCKLISPDNSGFLSQATWDGTKLVPTTSAAVAVWDANSSMNTSNWWQRKVYTALDTNGDGVIDSSDGDGTSPAGMYLLTASSTAGVKDLTGGISDAVADKLIPYMGIQGTTMCSDVEAALGITLPGAAAVRLRACTRAIINFALGEDLYNENLLKTTDANYRITNRISMLGDIFHSAPQNIGPPSSEADCNKNTRRCVSTLFVSQPAGSAHPVEYPANVIDPATGNQVTNPGTVDAYQAYYQHQTFGLKLPQATLVGANDGMLHAFQTACFVNTFTSGGVVYPSYWDGPGTGSCIAGSVANGTELWAFIPPDLLGKLGYILTGKHQYFVDSTPMVRDIYAPTSSTPTPTKRYTTTAPATMDFKRIAIVGERDGGNHWFGLDVTDPTAPKFRWMFPQPNSADELLTGFTYGEWVPNAPPIVPVRIAAPAGISGYPTYLDSSGIAQAFQEKWVAVLPGGYDPYGVLGKNVYMLDAYNGTKIFQMTPSASIPIDFPFAALPGTVAWGTQLAPGTPTYNNGFADTMFVGDMGGQMWTFRFNDVGQNVPVTNWFAGRAFKQVTADDSGAAAGEYRMQHRNPVFQMTSAARMPEGPLRIFVGTGDRANIAESGVGQCSIYNPLACGKQQCIMTMATNEQMGASAGPSGVSSFKGDLKATYISSTSAGTVNANACTPGSTVLNACVDCGPSPGIAGATISPPGEPQYACVYTSSGWQCSVRGIANPDAERLEVTTHSVSPDPYTDYGYFNRFFALNPFAQTTRPLFTTATQAATYDSNALTETDLVNLFGSGSFNPVTAPTVTGKTDGNGKGFYFTYPILDERTATNSLLLQSCVSWYSMQPGAPCLASSDCPGGGTCNTTTKTCQAPVACGGNASAIAARTAYLYQVNAVTGGSDCGLTSVTQLRSAAPTNAFLLPPPPAQQLISINAKGQIQYSIVAPAGQLSPGASAAAGGLVPFSFSYTIETPRELHQCRHGAAGVPDRNACY